MNNTVRTASVVCKDEVELLVIYQEDFDKTVRGPIYKQREEVITFCRNLHILKYDVHGVHGVLLFCKRQRLVEYCLNLLKPLRIPCHIKCTLHKLIFINFLEFMYPY